MRNIFFLIALTNLLACATPGVVHSDIAVHEQYSTMLDRCASLGQANGDVYLGLNAVNDRTTRTTNVRNAMRQKAKEMGGDALIPGELARSDMFGNYEFSMTVLNCAKQREQLEKTNDKGPIEKRLAELQELYEKGLITEQELKNARQDVLDDI